MLVEAEPIDLDQAMNDSNWLEATKKKKCVEDILKRFKVVGCNASVTPIDTMPKLEEDGSGGSVDPTMFRQLIGSLRYLCQSRSDINYAVGYVCRFINWYGDKVDRRRTSGHLFKFQNASVS
ncbi:hypothetical protein QL285_075839 [Trifolium repens]|nr:hypothetical protein QL285_075839 [Trifolium repens]